MKTLVVMAAGMGSRFGGLKQIEPVGPNGEFLLDYSVYDAKKAGFQKVVFVIKKELESTFRSTVGKRLEGNIEVGYAYQEIEDIPSNKKYLVSERKKPWGTIQAVLCAKSEVDGDFVVINADDFYGYDAYLKASKFLDEEKRENVYACISFPYNMTASKFGSVKRAVCYTEDDNIIKLVESKITSKDNFALAEPLNGESSFEIDLNQSVSMNMFAFKYHFFEYLEEFFKEYFMQDDDVILREEALLPDLVKSKIESKEIILKNIVSESIWMGMTYHEELMEIREKIRELIEEGDYPSNLWT